MPTASGSLSMRRSSTTCPSATHRFRRCPAFPASTALRDHQRPSAHKTCRDRRSRSTRPAQPVRTGVLGDGEQRITPRCNGPAGGNDYVAGMTMSLGAVHVRAKFETLGKWPTHGGKRCEVLSLNIKTPKVDAGKRGTAGTDDAVVAAIAKPGAEVASLRFVCEGGRERDRLRERELSFKPDQTVEAVKVVELRSSGG